MNRAAEFEVFVRGHRPRLLRSAVLLTAGDQHLAEDVVQSTLLRLYLAWPRVRRSSIEAYSRRALVNCFVDHTRRPFRRREVATAELPDVETTDGSGAEAAGSAAVWSALRELPAGMRTAVVLRHIEDLSVEDTARAMSCSEGTVKSQTARGLEKIRASVALTGTTNEGVNGWTR